MSASFTGKKTAAIAAAVLALGLASCGDDEEPSAGSTSEAQERSAQSADSDSKTKGSSQQGSDARNGSGNFKGVPDNDSSQSFTPRRHSDSGGGSEQFVVPGADNSVQEFGAEAGGSDFEQAATTLHTFYDARAARAWQVACEQLTANLVASLEGRSSPDAEPQMNCARGLEQMTNPQTRELQREEARIDVGSLRAEGDSGFLLYRNAESVVYAIAMQREGGDWKVANLAGLPLS